MQPFAKKLTRQLAFAALALGLALGAGCGRPETLVLVNVTGLDDTTIRELRVTMTLDGVAAKNGQPTAEDPDAMSFAVYKDMQRFGIDVPTGTQKLGVNIDALNSFRVAVRTGSGMVDLTQRKDLDVALHTP